jgi:hypothetical protein
MRQNRAVRRTLPVLLITAVALATAATVSAAEWSDIWSLGTPRPEEGTEIAMRDNGEVVVAGWAEIDGRGDNDIVVIKYGSDGSREWVHMYDAGLHNALGYDEPVGVGFDASGNVYVGGKARFQRSGTQDYDYVAIKLDPDGIHQWTRLHDYAGGSSDHGDDTATDMTVDAAGNVWITGDSDGDFLTVKWDASGTELWAARWDTTRSLATAITHDGAGAAYVTGYSQNPTTAEWDYLTIKYDATGTEAWTARHTDASEHEFKPWDIAVDANGNVAVTGHGCVGDLTTPWWDALTVRYTASGVKSWARTYTGTGHDGTFHDEGYAVAFDPDGDVVIAGFATMDGNGTDYLVIQYNGSSGTQRWVKHYSQVPDDADGDSLDYAYDLGIDAAGQIHVVGRLVIDWGGMGRDDTYGIVTYSNTGTVLQTRTFDANPALPFIDEALAVAVTGAGDLAVTGAASPAQTDPFPDIGTTVVYNGLGACLFCDGFESGTTSAWSN